MQCNKRERCVAPCSVVACSSEEKYPRRNASNIVTELSQLDGFDNPMSRCSDSNAYGFLCSKCSAGFFHLSSEEMLDDDFESFSVPNEAEETAGDLMTGEVYSVDVAASLKDVAQAMLDHKVHRVLVQEDGRYVGLLSTMEILAALSA